MSFWTEFFEPIGRKTLKELSIKVGGEFIQGDWNKKDEIIINYHNTRIIIDTHKKLRGKKFVLFYRIICPFKSTRNLTMSISTEDAFSHAAKIFGNQDIITGNEKFDNEFFLESNNEQLFLEFIQSEIFQKKYLESLKKLSYFPFCIKVKTSVLDSSHYCVYNESNSYQIETLVEYITLCKITLDRLIEIGEAEDIAPNI